jgi:AraC family transcriptional activator of tynA and feaB
MGKQPERASFWSAGLGTGRAVRVGNLAARVERPARQRDEASGFIKLLLQVRGESLVATDGKRARLLAGDATLLDADRCFAIELGSDYEQLFFQLPRAVVARRHVSLLGLVGQALRGEEPNHALVFDALSVMASHLDGLSELRRAQLSSSIVELLGTLEPARAERSVSRRRHLRALADLEIHLADPELSAPMLAALQGLSRRRLDAIFAENGQSVERVIWGRRLERIALELQDPSKRALRLIDVALAWGFNSEAHFSRVFSKRFGETPSAFRRRLAGRAQPSGPGRRQT